MIDFITIVDTISFLSYNVLHMTETPENGPSLGNEDKCKVTNFVTGENPSYPVLSRWDGTYRDLFLFLSL